MIVQLEKYKVLLIGDACHDVYIFVEEQRKNPETDAPLLTEIGRLVTGGMGRNTLKCLQKLELNVDAILPNVNIDKVRFIDNISGKQYFRLDNDLLQKETELPNDLSKYDCIVISDYNKGFITDNTIKTIGERYKGPIFLDTKKKNLQDFSFCFIKINEHEAYEADSIPSYTTVTEGSRGARHIDPYWNEHTPALKVDCVDVCGAGDAFLAGYVFGYLLRKSLQIAMIYGVVNAGISVTKRGTYAPSKSELIERMQQYVKQCGED